MSRASLITKYDWEGDERLKASLANWGLPAEVVAELVGHHTSVTHSKGSVIFSRGSRADILCWIRTGFIALYYPLDDGRRVLARLCRPGEVIGYVDFIDDHGHRVHAFEAIARAKCQIALMTREHVVEVLRRLDTDAMMPLIERLNTGRSMELQHWVRFAGMHFRQRLELVLADLATRCGVEDDRGTLLLPELSHDTLAEMIGSSRPIVGRLLSEMMNERVIIRDDGRYILRKIPKLLM
jgi:CRP/FNR family transcriptional regulator, polysaccharide utilization system transcription regulator